MSSSELSFTLRNQQSEIGRMFSLVEGYCQANGISDDDLFNVRLVLDEAVINIMTHGYDHPGDHDIHVSLRLDGHLLTIVIDDDGVAYNPLDAPEPRFDLPIEQRRIGGLGVHIMRTLAKSVQYQRDADRNHLTLEMSIGVEDGSANPA